MATTFLYRCRTPPDRAGMVRRLLARLSDRNEFAVRDLSKVVEGLLQTNCFFLRRRNFIFDRGVAFIAPQQYSDADNAGRRALILSLIALAGRHVLPAAETETGSSLLWFVTIEVSSANRIWPSLTPEGQLRIG